MRMKRKKEMFVDDIVQVHFASGMARYALVTLQPQEEKASLLFPNPIPLHHAAATLPSRVQLHVATYHQAQRSLCAEKE